MRCRSKRRTSTGLPRPIAAVCCAALARCRLLVVKAGFLGPSCAGILRRWLAPGAHLHDGT
jgi:hypothetical protein